MILARIGECGRSAARRHGRAAPGTVDRSPYRRRPLHPADRRWALLDFLSGAVPRAPLWMRRLRVEWLFRLFLSRSACGGAMSSAIRSSSSVCSVRRSSAAADADEQHYRPMDPRSGRQDRRRRLSSLRATRRFRTVPTTVRNDRQRVRARAPTISWSQVTTLLGSRSWKGATARSSTSAISCPPGFTPCAIH